MTDSDEDPTSPNHIPRVFTRIPWCQRLLDDPDFDKENLAKPKYEGGFNTFWYQHLTTPEAVRARLCLYRRPTTATTPLDDTSEDVRETRELFDLGPALMGQRGIIHGGFLCTMMDEVCGMLIHTYKLDGGREPFTVTLNTTYLKPVWGPAVVMVKGRIVSTEGRKIRILTELVDGQGDVCVRTESLFVRKREGAL